MNISNLCILNHTPLLYRLKGLILLLILLSNLTHPTSCTSVTLGIDWGEEYVEASIAFRGHRPDILLTGTGSRKFENAVYLLGETRLFDKEASAFALKDPTKTFQKSAHLLGIPFSANSKWTRMSTPKAAEVAETFKKNNVSFHWDYTPYEFGVAKDGQLHLKVLKDAMVGLEEATAHFFNHLKNVALEKLLSVKAIESLDAEVEMMAVISIPCGYTQNQRKALMFAAESAGLKVVDLVHGITAAAWLNTMEMAPGHKKILFYDLGSSGANVGVVEAKVPAAKSKDFPQIKTLSCVTYPGIGGRQHDLLLAEFLRQKFEADHNVKLMPANPRSLQKLLRSVNKAKMKLSLSETASVEVENLVKNKHLNYKLTRSDYDKLLDPVLKQLHVPLNMALERANLKLSDLDSVEMLGGAWRVPAVTNKLSELVKPLQLGFHLNAEESIALGCGYLAAGHNPFFRMKKMELADNAVFDYVLHVKGPDLDKKVTLYKSGDRINHSKVVKVNTLNNFTVAIYETFALAGNANNSNNVSTFPDLKVLDYKVSGVDDLLAKHREDKLAQVTLSFKTENGVIRLNKVSAKPVKRSFDKKHKSKTEQSLGEVEDASATPKEPADEGAQSQEQEGEASGSQAKAQEPEQTESQASASDSTQDLKQASHESEPVSDSKDKSEEATGASTGKESATGQADDSHAESSPSGESVEGSKPEDAPGSEDSKVDPGAQEKPKDDKKHKDKKDKGEKQPNAKGEKGSADSLKDKLLNKLNEEQVDLEFVDNTFDLYHSKKLHQTKKNIEVLVNRDKVAVERSNSKNRLESTLYKYKTVLKSEAFKAACKPNEEQVLGEKVKTLLDWFDENAFNAGVESFNKHFDELNELGLPIYKRMDSNLNRESLVKSTDEEFAQLQEKLRALLEEKAFLKEQASTLELFQNNVTWWEKVKSEQASRPLFEEGLFDSASVKSKLDLAKMLLRNLQNIAPPEPPKTEGDQETSESTPEGKPEAAAPEVEKAGESQEPPSPEQAQAPESAAEPLLEAPASAEEAAKHSEL